MVDEQMPLTPFIVGVPSETLDIPRTSVESSVFVSSTSITDTILSGKAGKELVITRISVKCINDTGNIRFYKLLYKDEVVYNATLPGGITNDSINELIDLTNTIVLKEGEVLTTEQSNVFGGTTAFEVSANFVERSASFI